MVDSIELSFITCINVEIRLLTMTLRFCVFIQVSFKRSKCIMINTCTTLLQLIDYKIVGSFGLINLGALYNHALSTICPSSLLSLTAHLATVLHFETSYLVWICTYAP